MDLLSWAEVFLNHRRSVGLLRSCVKKEGFFEVTLKSGVSGRALVSSSLDVSLLADDVLFLIVPNSLLNVRFLIDNWDSFVSFSSLTIVFVNPVVNEYWLIKPFVHSRIADPDSLAEGLLSMHQSVPVVD